MLHNFAQTHIGQRKVNEDSFLINEDLGLYIVADGVGGMSKGEIASSLACDTVLQNIQSGMPLEESVYLAHRTIVNEIKSDASKQGMATTIVAVLFTNNLYEVAWVGDSRLYLWDGHLKLLTKDDSYVELLLENGHIGVDELETHPDRNVISQALGIERKNININTNSGSLEQDQMLLLCSDGLYGIANELDIINSIKAENNLEDITERLVRLAVDKQGKDNITLIAIKSDHNSVKSVSANVFREFDIKTGKILGAENNNKISKVVVQSKFNKNLASTEETDPELIDQTAYHDLSEEQRKMLEEATKDNSPEASYNSSLIPILLLAILVLVGFILLK